MGRTTFRTTGTALAAAALLAAGAGPLAAPLAAQEERFPGVELGLVYEAFTPGLAVKPFGSGFGGASVAPLAEAIVARDLRYSDRYQMLDSVPRALAAGEGIDYTLWDRLGVTWLLTGRVEGSGDGYVLVLELHDVPFAQVKERDAFAVPNPDDPGFRMAVHRVSDRVVEWTHGEPGMAASRIAFAMRRGSGPKELWVVDSDGENLRRLTNHESVVLSPAWSPDGARIAYVTDAERPWDIFVHDLREGRSTRLDIDRSGMPMTPVWHPDGETLAFTVRAGTRSGIFTYNVDRECCLTNLVEGPRIDVSPTYSPDGRRLAFNSDRLGETVPQIYVMPAGGGDAELISPYRYGGQGHYNSPDWSPTGGHVTFHGRIGRYGRYQILVAPVDGPGGRLVQLTSEGNNEDPSWAPDGRHLVFVGARDWGQGLFVVDTATGRLRVLLHGVAEGATPQWSPSL